MTSMSMRDTMDHYEKRREDTQNRQVDERNFYQKKKERGKKVKYWKMTNNTRRFAACKRFVCKKV